MADAHQPDEPGGAPDSRGSGIALQPRAGRWTRGRATRHCNGGPAGRCRRWPVRLGRSGDTSLEERMTAIVLPDIDLDQLRKNIPSLAEIDLPSLGKAGARADDAIDSWRGKSRG